MEQYFYWTVFDIFYCNLSFFATDIKPKYKKIMGSEKINRSTLLHASGNIVNPFIHRVNLTVWDKLQVFHFSFFLVISN